MLRLSLLLFLTFCLYTSPARAFCFNEAGEKYRVDPLLVEAISTGESGLKADITHDNRNKDTGKVSSRDYGLMQINSTHVPELIRLGFIHDANDLLTRPCLNVQIGTWILAKHFQVCGISWNCLGSYNAGFRADRHETREAYANRIYAIYLRLLRERRGIVL